MSKFEKAIPHRFILRLIACLRTGCGSQQDCGLFRKSLSD